eukprot:CAMPEP_0183335782 /NCGR_PEP_ID=MMETSP0164_2-20130417/3972_1 /TAXON_ID=221442 /ORGANISM="Coccolithus pelagicus ssp braarudi, Strain PLY182g" /LENGTH=56 /DNA_ID=CAMNT_0025505195 /DNA_START=253 /DNA_END=419 /DNA_ORIENTATION=+
MHAHAAAAHLKDLGPRWLVVSDQRNPGIRAVCIHPGDGERHQAACICMRLSAARSS